MNRTYDQGTQEQRIVSPLVRYTFLVILTCILLSFVQSCHVTGTTWIVDDTEGNWRDYDSIQDALNVSSDGDVIRVHSGEYNETLVVENEISIIGNGSESTYIMVEKEDGVITINSDGVTLIGCVLKNAGTSHSKAVIRIHEYDDFFISDCLIIDSRTGIDIEYSTNGTMMNCSFLDNNNIGIFVKYSDNITISSCIIMTGLEEDIFLYNCTNITVENSSTITGIRLWGSDKWHYNTLAIVNTTINGNPIVVLINQSDLTLKSVVSQIIIIECNDLIIDSASLHRVSYGLIIVHSSNITTLNSIFHNCSQYGIYARESPNLIFENCTIYQNGKGLSINGGNYHRLVNCLIENNTDWGLILGSASHCFISNCSAYINQGSSAIYFYYLNNSSIENSTLTGYNYETGLRIDKSSNNRILNNTFNGAGLKLDEAPNTVISECNFYKRDNVIEDSINIMIVANYFLESGIGVYNSDHSQIIGNLFNDTMGVRLSGSECVVKDNRFVQTGDEYLSIGGDFCIVENCTDIGIKVQGLGNHIVNNCSSTGYRYHGLRIYQSNNNTISNCHFSNAIHGLGVSDSRDNTITDCTFFSCTDFGIRLGVSENNTITNCSIRKTKFDPSESYWDFTGFGIYLERAHSNTILNCQLMKNRFGVKCIDSNNNTFAFNEFYRNRNDSVRMNLDSDYNEFYGNGFFGNINGSSPEPFDLSNTTIWHDGSAGNYWLDYNETDNDGDGIGDIPYLIGPWKGNKDPFPIMDWNWSHEYKEPDPSEVLPKITAEVWTIGNLVEGEWITVHVRLTGNPILPRGNDTTVIINVTQGDDVIGVFNYSIEIPNGTAIYSISRNITFNNSGDILVMADVSIGNVSIVSGRRGGYIAPLRHSFTLSLDQTKVTDDPGTTVHLEMMVKNTGNVNETIRLSCNESWVRFTPSEITIGPWNKTEVNVTIQIPDGFSGSKNLTLIAECIYDDEVVYGQNVMITINEHEQDDKSIIIVVILIGACAVFSMGAGFATDRGRAFLFLGLVPLYHRIKKTEVMNNETRGMIVKYLADNPGAHYQMIKQDLDLTNGVLGYHLNVLERSGYLKSSNDGFYRRFYPYGFEIPKIELTRKEKKILRTIGSNPGISQTLISIEVGLAQPTVSYHIKELMGKGAIVPSDKKGYRVTKEFQAIALTGSN